MTIIDNEGTKHEIIRYFENEITILKCDLKNWDNCPKYYKIPMSERVKFKKTLKMQDYKRFLECLKRL